MKMIQSRSKKFISIMTVFFAVLFGMMATGCGGGGGGGTVDDAVVKPGVPENFEITAARGQGMITLTLTWDAPITGDAVDTYEIYRSDTADSVFHPDNHLISLSADTFTFSENFGMEENVTSYWVVSAKNAGGETPTAPLTYTPTTGETEGYGNNFAAAMVFADGLGISGLPITGVWIEDGVNDYNTGFRPSEAEMAALTRFPYFDENTTYIIPDDPTQTVYYKQQTVSTWQGEWKDGQSEPQHVTAKWGDNLISQNLTIDKPVRIEMVLTKALDTNMTAYNMRSLYGTKRNEIYGTDTTTKTVDTAFVFAANAHLTIQKVDDNGSLYDPLYDQPLWQCDGPGCFGAEVNVAGNFTYGFVWLLQEEDISNEPYGKAGTWRITFTLDPTSPKSTDNNTFIDTAANGVLDSNTSVHIDIQIAQ